jgi:methylphosphotriester-DNA--protein-cysteine methyltransferase
MVSASETLRAAASLLSSRGLGDWLDGEFLFDIWTGTLWTRGYRPGRRSDGTSDWSEALEQWNAASVLLTDVADSLETAAQAQRSEGGWHPAQAATTTLAQLAYLFHTHTGATIGISADGPAARFCRAVLAHLRRPTFTPAQWNAAARTAKGW